MTPIFPELPYTLGVYTLSRLIEQRENSVLYEAMQNHVNRAVVLEVLHPGVSHAEEVAFLAQARHRVAACNIPHVSDVYESLRSEGIWFLTQEQPAGRSLADIAEAGEQLRVLYICCIIAAAAEMYSEYAATNQAAMPLAPSSIYLEPSGVVHFLSPLVVGISNNPPAQMQALAAALCPLYPQTKEPGLGRASTLLQWLTEGIDGRFLEWQEILETARTIINQLVNDEQADANSSFISRLAKRIWNNTAVRQTRQFISMWGAYVGSAAGIIIVLSAAGSMFGSGAPKTEPACQASGFLCQHRDTNELVLRYPVSVKQYAEFMRQFAEMDETQRNNLLASVPQPCDTLTPADWDTQWEAGDIESPVTGVTYWQALLYAHFMNGELPTAAQLQTIQPLGAMLLDWEWTRDAQESPLPGIMDGNAYLLVDSEGKIKPTHSRDWQDKRCGFRITLPESQE